jgi:hypothetical protein
MAEDDEDGAELDLFKTGRRAAPRTLGRDADAGSAVGSMEAENGFIGPPPRFWDADQEDDPEFPQPDDDFSPSRNKGFEGEELQDAEAPSTMSNEGDSSQFKPSGTDRGTPTPSSPTRQVGGLAASRAPPRSRQDGAGRLTLPSSALRGTGDARPRHLEQRKPSAAGERALVDRSGTYCLHVPYTSDGYFGIEIAQTMSGRRIVTWCNPRVEIYITSPPGEEACLYLHNDEILKVDDEDTSNMSWDVFQGRLKRSSAEQQFKTLLMRHGVYPPCCSSPPSLEVENLRKRRGFEGADPSHKRAKYDQRDLEHEGSPGRSLSRPPLGTVSSLNSPFGRKSTGTLEEDVHDDEFERMLERVDLYRTQKNDLLLCNAVLKEQLETSVRERQTDKGSLQAQVNMTRQQLASARSSNESLKHLLKSTEKDKSSLSKMVRDLTTANEALHGEKNDLQSCNASLKEKLEVSEQQFASVLEDQSSLLKTVQELTTTNVGLQDEKDALQSYSASLQAKLEVSEQQRASFQEDRSSLLETVQELTTDKASLQTENDDLQSLNASIEAQLTKVQRDSALLQEQLEKSQQQRRDDKELFKLQLEAAQEQFQGENAALQEQLEKSQQQRRDDKKSFNLQLEAAQEQFQGENAGLQEQLEKSQQRRRDENESFNLQLEAAQKQLQGDNAALQEQLEKSQQRRRDETESFKLQLEAVQKQLQGDNAALQEQLVASQRDRAVLQAGLNRDASARAMLVPFLLSTNIPGYRLVSEEEQQLARGDGDAAEAENGQGRSRNALPHPANEVASASRPGDSNPNRPAAPALNGADPDAPRQWWPFWNRARET